MSWDPNERPLNQPYREDSERELAWGIRRTETYRSMAEAEKLEKEVRRGWKQLRRGRRNRDVTIQQETDGAVQRVEVKGVRSKGDLNVNVTQR